MNIYCYSLWDTLKYIYVRLDMYGLFWILNREYLSEENVTRVYTKRMKLDTLLDVLLGSSKTIASETLCIYVL